MLFRFGAFELDDQLFQLRHAGAPVALQPRVFDLLVFLLRKRNVVVTRADLLAEVWGGTVVTKDAVAQAIMALRKALGDDGEVPQFIETVRARGYRFVAPVTTSATVAPPSAQPSSSVLAGVGLKLAKLVSRVERGGGVVLVTGEPGAGRTRFVTELADRIRSAVVVRCAAPGAPKLWLVKEVLRELHARGARLEGALSDVLEGTFDTTSLDVPSARFAFADTLLDATVRCAAGKPLLIVADDLHAADESTLSLVEVLAPRLRSTPIVLCATYARTSSGAGRGFDALLGALSHEPTVAVVRLEPFTRAEVAAFLKATTGRELSDALVDRIHDKTRGNALLLAQIVQRESTDWLQKDVKTGPLVDSGLLREAIGRQLAGLPEDRRHVLTMAAVFGNSFTVAPLAAALDRPNDETLGALDDAVRAGVLRRESTTAYHFMYPVVRDVLHEQLSGLARARLHGLAAKALEAHVDGSDDHERVGELAGHFVEAAATGDVDAAIDWSLRAADLAKSARDHEAAARYAERALAAYQFAERPDPDKRARLRAHLTK